MTEAVATSQTILVVGGGISGMTAALEVAYGGTPKEAGLDGHLIKPTKLREIAVKVVKK